MACCVGHDWPDATMLPSGQEITTGVVGSVVTADEAGGGVVEFTGSVGGGVVEVIATVDSDPVDEGGGALDGGIAEPTATLDGATVDVDAGAVDDCGGALGGVPVGFPPSSDGSGTSCLTFHFPLSSTASTSKPNLSSTLRPSGNVIC